jgi:hypothetical protein
MAGTLFTVRFVRSIVTLAYSPQVRKAQNSATAYAITLGVAQSGQVLARGIRRTVQDENENWVLVVVRAPNPRHSRWVVLNRLYSYKSDA